MRTTLKRSNVSDRLIFYSFIIFCLLAYTNAVAGDTYTKTFNVSNFDKLNIGSTFTIRITPGEQFKVTATGEREKVNEILADVKNGELTVKYKESSSGIKIRQSIQINITMPILKAVNFSGTTSSVINPGFEASNFVAYLSGNAASEIHINAQDIFVDVNSTSSLKLIGKGTHLKATAEGVADVMAYEFPVESATLEAVGTSTIKVNASNTIKAKATGASTIRYKGTAKQTEVQVSKLSSIKKVE